MVHKKKAITIIMLASFVLIGTAATTGPERKYRNLKVLPQDIDERQLDSIMNTYNKALNVSCDFCHSAAENKFPLTPVTEGLDFALDNAMKENARKMMRMTIDINKNYFNQDTTVQKMDHLLNVVTCNTCHRGNPFPAHE